MSQQGLFDRGMCAHCNASYGVRRYMDGMWCDECVITHQAGVIRTLTRTLEEGRGTVSDARHAVARVLSSEGGVMDCPVCDQRVQTYRRRPHTSMCLFLVDMVRVWAAREHDWTADARGPWVHRREVNHAANDYSYLALFGRLDGEDVGESMTPVEGLIEALPGEPGKVKPGWWRPTPTALAWIKGECEVRAWVDLYNGAIVWRSAEGVTFKDAVGDGFDLEDVMGVARDAARRC